MWSILRGYNSVGYCPLNVRKNILLSMSQTVMQWSNEWRYLYFIFSRHPFHEIDKVHILLKFRVAYSRTGKWHLNENSLWTRSLLCRVKGSRRLKCLQLGVRMPVSKFSSLFLCLGWNISTYRTFALCCMSAFCVVFVEHVVVHYISRSVVFKRSGLVWKE